MTALYLAVTKMKPGSAVIMVRDYKGVLDCIEGRSKP
jgi:hypothetical protein